MKIKSITINAPLEITPVEERIYDLMKDLEVSIVTDDGVYRYTLKKGFRTNFRSGSNIIDCFVPHIGKQMVAIAYLIHDANYNSSDTCSHLVSKELADKLLEAMLVYAGVSKVKAKIVKKSVQWFGQSAYDEYDDICKHNQGLYWFRWDSK